MNLEWLEAILAEGLVVVSAFTPRVGIFLFVVCFVAEAAFVSIPLVFETTWLTAGYQLSRGVLPVPDLILMMLSAEFGRQAGGLILYSLSLRGTSFIRKFMDPRLPKKVPDSRILGKLVGQIDSISPFAVALGRMLWLRIPLTVLLGTRRKLKTLALGIAISGIIYDGIYITLGVVIGRTAIPETPYVLVFFAGGVAALWVVSFGSRYVYGAIKRRLSSTTNK